MKGYWRNEEATRETMDGEWLRTGDVAYYDDDDYFYVVDRMKELIKVKGFQVSNQFPIPRTYFGITFVWEAPISCTAAVAFTEKFRKKLHIPTKEVVVVIMGFLAKAYYHLQMRINPTPLYKQKQGLTILLECNVYFP